METEIVAHNFEDIGFSETYENSTLMKMKLASNTRQDITQLSKYTQKMYRKIRGDYNL